MALFTSTASALCHATADDAGRGNRTSTPGASALTGQTTTNIRGRLHRREKFRTPFPAPHNYFAMTWWKLSELRAWIALDSSEQAAAGS